MLAPSALAGDKPPAVGVGAELPDWPSGDLVALVPPPKSALKAPIGSLELPLPPKGKLKIAPRSCSGDTPFVFGAAMVARHLKALHPSSEKSPDFSSSSALNPLSYSSCSTSVIFERASIEATVSFLAYACIATAP